MAQSGTGKFVEVTIRSREMVIETTEGVITINPSRKDGYLVAYNRHDEGGQPTETIQ